MPDYISVDVLRAYLTESMGKFDKAVAARRIKPNTAMLAHSMIKGINDAIGGRFLPLTADVVPVVRCKDCIYSVRRLHEIENYRLCQLGDHPTRDDYFCSFGIKKEDENGRG